MSNSVRTLLYVFSICGFAIILVMDLLKIIRTKSVKEKIKLIRYTLYSLALILIIYSGSLILMWIMLIADLIGVSAIRHYKKLI